MNMDDRAYPFSLVKELSFRRVAGTEDERRAAQILLREIEDESQRGLADL